MHGQTYEWLNRIVVQVVDLHLSDGHRLDGALDTQNVGSGVDLRVGPIGDDLVRQRRGGKASRAEAKSEEGAEGAE